MGNYRKYLQSRPADYLMNSELPAASSTVVTDLVVPDRDASETIQTIRKVFPEQKISLVSGVFEGKCSEVVEVGRCVHMVFRIPTSDAKYPFAPAHAAEVTCVGQGCENFKLLV